MTDGTDCSAELTSVSPKASLLKQDRQKNNYCNNGKMGKGKSHVNIKKSYEKNTTEVQNSDNFTEILQEIIVSFKECKSKSCEQ